MNNKKKLNRKDYIFDGIKDNNNLIKPPGAINGIDFCIMNLENCEVYLCDHIA
jgi:protein XRP2